MAPFYSLENVLAVAAIHPFYTFSAKYPPSTERIALALESEDELASSEHSKQRFLHKSKLYETIGRLFADDDPENYYRRNSYVSITGGGSGKSLPMVFLTDVQENQNQRMAMSQLMKACRLIEPVDWVLNCHPGDSLYRALDLTTQIIEQAGGSVLCVGHKMPHEKSLNACIKYRVNVITGDAPQIVNFAHHVCSLPFSVRRTLRITKIIYTCEMMSKSKREYLVSAFGPLSFYSIFASAETGPWAVADLNEVGDAEDDSTVDFLYDYRTMDVEVISLDSKALESNSSCTPEEKDFVAEGTAGHLVLTSLQRLKNPLVRYISGDVASLHPLPNLSFAQIDPNVRPYLKILRLHGRDKRFSFKWMGEYFEFEKLDKVMETEEWGVLQWQVIIEFCKQWDGSDSLELRLMRRMEGKNILPNKALLECLHDVFFLTDLNKKFFQTIFVDDLRGFERSENGAKVPRFIDKRI